MSYLGDISTSQILYFHFTTRQFSTGTPITAANLAVSVYKDDSTTQSTAGVTVTFTTGFDNVVGLVSVKIDTSQDGTFYAAAHDFSVVVTTGTADSVSIVGEVVGYFSINNRTALRSTTAGRTINIDSTGLADSNVVKLGPTGTGTAQTARDIGASVLVGDKTGFSLSTGGIQAIWDALTSALTTVSSIGKLLVDNINASISSRSTYAGADTSGTTTLLTRIASALTITTGKVDVNDKTGFALTSAYDPAKTAMQDGGNAVATNMRGTDNALLAVNYTAPDNASVTAIKTQTDKLVFGVANQVDANIQSINNTTITGDGQPGTEFGV